MFVVSSVCVLVTLWYINYNDIDGTRVHILPPTDPPMITPQFVSITCGQDVILPSSRVANLTLSCLVLNVSVPVTTKVFKDGVFIGSSFERTITAFGDDDFGTYKFVASIEGCSEVAAVTRILGES